MPHGVPNIQVTPPRKPWWASRTMWLNLLVALLAVAESRFALLQPLLPVNVYAAIAFALPVANALLRVVTTTGLQFGQTDAREGA